MSQPHWSIFCLNLKESYYVIITKIITLSTAFVCEEIPIRFSNEANTFVSSLFPVWSYKVFHLRQGWRNPFSYNWHGCSSIITCLNSCWQIREHWKVIKFVFWCFEDIVQCHELVTGAIHILNSTVKNRSWPQITSSLNFHSHTSFLRFWYICIFVCRPPLEDSNSFCYIYIYVSKIFKFLLLAFFLATMNLIFKFSIDPHFF